MFSEKSKNKYGKCGCAAFIEMHFKDEYKHKLLLEDFLDGDAEEIAASGENIDITNEDV